jgi:hypothetical protein
MIEAGVIYRDRDLRIGSDFDEGDTLQKTSTYAARAMVGWSWLVTRHLFVEIAAGVSAGYESGHAAPPAPETTYKVSGREIVPEGHVHIGLAFGR